MANQVVRPKNRREFMNELVDPYDKKSGNPNQIFTEPQKLGQPSINRALEVSNRNDSDKDFTIGIKDIDEAIMYYFTNVLRLAVIQNNTRIPIPILYGTPENWKSIQQDGFYRDENNKLIAPLIMFKRKSVTQNRDLGYKLDGNAVHNVQLFEKKYSKRNFYSNFNVLNSRSPEKKYVVSATPDYVTIEYECIIWTSYIEQMDKIVEQINFASRSYWGDPNRFQFFSSIESFEDQLTYAVGENRTAKSNFNITLNGYLIPDSLNRKLATPANRYGVAEVKFGLELASGTEEFAVKVSKGKSSNVKNVLLTDSVNINNTIVQGGASDAVVSYLNINKTVTGTYVSSTTVSFTSGWASAPSPLPATSTSNFNFFVNGMYVEPTSIVSFTNGGTSSVLVIDVSLLGYSFESTDVIIGIGKFN
jgi:hypothetical protein